jgi:hypothetical protein
VPLEHFELYYCGKRLKGEAALASWGVEKGSTIEVKMRGRGGMPTGDEACELSQTSPSLGAGRVTAILPNAHRLREMPTLRQRRDTTHRPAKKQSRW